MRKAVAPKWPRILKGKRRNPKIGGHRRVPTTCAIYRLPKAGATVTQWAKAVYIHLLKNSANNRFALIKVVLGAVSELFGKNLEIVRSRYTQPNDDQKYLHCVYGKTRRKRPSFNERSLFYRKHPPILDCTHQ